MKPNHEISLKFWISMAAFFCIVLSFPLSDYLIDKNIVNYRELYGISLVIITMLIGITVAISLRYSELKNKHKNSKFFSDISFQTLEDYETQIKKQSDEIDRKNTKIEQLTTAFEDAVVEITRLRSENETLTENRTYWKERALHKKHTKKEIDSEWWECITDVYLSFTKGEKYKKVKSKLENKQLIMLISNDGLSTFLVKKDNFNPVK